MKNQESGYKDSNPIQKIEIHNLSKHSSGEFGTRSNDQSFGMLMDNSLFNNVQTGGPIYGQHDQFAHNHYPQDTRFQYDQGFAHHGSLPVLENFNQNLDNRPSIQNMNQGSSQAYYSQTNFNKHSQILTIPQTQSQTNFHSGSLNQKSLSKNHTLTHKNSSLPKGSRLGGRVGSSRSALKIKQPDYMVSESNEVNEYLMNYGTANNQIMKPNNTIILKDAGHSKSSKTLRPASNMMVQGRNITNLNRQNNGSLSSKNLRQDYFTAQQIVNQYENRSNNTGSSLRNRAVPGYQTKVIKSKYDDLNSIAVKKTSVQASESQTAAALALERYRSSAGLVEDSFINALTQSNQHLQENSVEHKAQRVNFDLSPMNKQLYNRPTTAQQKRASGLAVHPERGPSRQNQNKGGILVSNSKAPLTASRASLGTQRQIERKFGKNGYFNKVTLRSGNQLQAINSKDAQNFLKNNISLIDNLSQSTQAGPKIEIQLNPDKMKQAQLSLRKYQALKYSRQRPRTAALNQGQKMKGSKLTQNAYNHFVTHITQTSSQAVSTTQKTSFKQPTSKSPQSKNSAGESKKKLHFATKLNTSSNINIMTENVSENTNVLKNMSKNASAKDIQRINSAKKDIDYLKSQKLPPQHVYNLQTQETSHSKLKSPSVQSLQMKMPSVSTNDYIQKGNNLAIAKARNMIQDSLPTSKKESRRPSILNVNLTHPNQDLQTVSKTEDSSTMSQPNYDRFLERIGYITQFHFGLSQLTKDLNANVTSHIDVFQKAQSSVEQRWMNRIASIDGSKKINAMAKRIKMLKFQCSKTVAGETERIIQLSTNPVSGGKGAVMGLDVVENCLVVCKVNVKHRKAPLKISLQYQQGGKQLVTIDMRHISKLKKPKSSKQSTAITDSQEEDSSKILVDQLPDLRIYVSDSDQNPSESNCILKFINPQSRILIKPQSHAQLQEENTDVVKKQEFDNEFVYVGFESTEGCTLKLQCSFPGEELDKSNLDFGQKDIENSKKSVRFTSKQAIKEKFQKQVEAIMDKLDGDDGKYEDFLEDIQKRQKKLKRLDLNECSINFVRDNVIVAQHINQYKAELNYNRQEVDFKIEKAQNNRALIQDQKEARQKFNMIKWELYRQKIDQIDEDHAFFKKLQKKVFCWLQIILRDVAVKNVIKKFNEHFQKVRRQQLVEAMHRRIKFYSLRYHQKFGENLEFRKQNTIRNILSFGALPSLKQYQQKSKVVIQEFMKQQLLEFEMKAKFKIPSLAVFKIKQSLKHAWNTRLQRLTDLDEFFENERKTMLKYYQDKLKKGKDKKLKKEIESLKSLQFDYEIKFQVLTFWYVHKMSASNLIHAIYYNAHIQIDCGLQPRGNEDDPLYGQITDKEKADLEALYNNKKLATEHLMPKYIQNGKFPVGQISEKDAEEKFSPEFRQSSAGLMRAPTMDLTTIMASSESRNMAAGATNQSGIMTTIPETVELPDPKKEKSKSKSKERKESPSKKGGKKKKTSKEAEEYVQGYEIPDNFKTKGLNLYRPDRGTMQRLVKRASDLKDQKKEKDQVDITKFQDVAPWFRKGSKQINQDLDLDEQVAQQDQVCSQYDLVLKLFRDIHQQKEDFRRKQMVLS